MHPWIRKLFLIELLVGSFEYLEVNKVKDYFFGVDWLISLYLNENSA